MRQTKRSWCSLGTGLLLLLTLACDGSGTDAVLGTDQPVAGMAGFHVNGQIPVREGLTLGADPREVRLVRCDPAAPTPVESELLGETVVGAFVRDAELRPVAGVPVVFSSTAGVLQSSGQPVLTDERGLATDVLSVHEGDAGDVVVTAVTDTLTATLTIPVLLLPDPPITLGMDPAELWPPNHKMREVTAVFGGSSCHPGTTFELVSVTSNEPDDGNGDGSTGGDIQGAEIGTEDTVMLLRAERAGGGSGRIYTVTYALTDEAGESRLLSAVVTVPHDQGH